MPNILKTPQVAGVITGRISAAEVRRAERFGASVIEVRVDTFSDLDPASLETSFKRLKGYSALPLLLTIRSRKEGGKYPFNEGKRLDLFKSLIPFADIVDIELSSGRIAENVVDFAKGKGKRVIVSCHDFRATPGPERLKKIIEEGRKAGASAVKIAAFARKDSDIKTLARLLLDFNDLIVIAMGEKGVLSRVFFPALGSLLTYGPVTGVTAPGQLPLKDLCGAVKRFGAL